MVEWTARRAGFTAQVAADAALGLMTAHFAPVREDADWMLFYADLKDKADRCGGSFIIERMPDALRARDMPVWSPLLPDFGLMARLKETLDPPGCGIRAGLSASYEPDTARTRLNGLRPLRPVPAGLPDLSGNRQRGGQPARADRADAKDARGQPVAVAMPM